MPSDQARAFGAGTVALDGAMSGYGNSVFVDHGVAYDGQTHLFSLYAHLATADNFGSDLSVTAGQSLGQIGASGGNYAVHLHFELFDAETWAIGVNLGGGSAYDWEVEGAESVTFDAMGNITPVLLTVEVDASRAGREDARHFTSDAFIDIDAGRDRWYGSDGVDTLSYGGGKRVEAFGSGGDDHLTGGAQIDLLAGGGGNRQACRRQGRG